MIKLLGYFVHKDDELSPGTVMVVIDEKQRRLTCYCPIGQHSEMDRGYFAECIQISKDEYLKASEGDYTPSDYLNWEIGEWMK
jgi:hypothetical protein